MRTIAFILACALPYCLAAALSVGVGKREITPPLGTPSAGYAERQGCPMEGVKDPLMATAIYLDNGEKKIVLCSVDHLGFTESMVQEIISKAGLPGAEIYIASTHTHSGGGAYLDIPVIGEALAGKYDPAIKAFYVQKTVEAIQEAYGNLQPARLGIGYGQAETLSKYRASVPKDIVPLRDVVIFKIEKEEGGPLAVLINYPLHPTCLTAKNKLFSADFVGDLRVNIAQLLGCETLYFNGAQGEIIPAIDDASLIGESLGKTVKQIWDETPVTDTLSIKTVKEAYSFTPQATPFGLELPLPEYHTEMNALVFDGKHAFVTIPGELSCVYARELNISIWGLTNGAHGYIILPESWRQKTYESRLSFGGELYGEEVKARALRLLKTLD